LASERRPYLGALELEGMLSGELLHRHGKRFSTVDGGLFSAIAAVQQPSPTWQFCIVKRMLGFAYESWSDSQSAFLIRNFLS
jgi:hypothetical protein